MLALYTWESVEAADKVGPRASGTSARTCVFLLIVYIFYPAPPPPLPPPRSLLHTQTLSLQRSGGSTERPLRFQPVGSSFTEVWMWVPGPTCRPAKGIQQAGTLLEEGKRNVGVPTRFLELLCEECCEIRGAPRLPPPPNRNPLFGPCVIWSPSSYSYLKAPPTYSHKKYLSFCQNNVTHKEILFSRKTFSA